jgi:triosephosphate isomerase
MNKDQFEAGILAEELANELKNEEEIEIVLCPPFTSLAVVYQRIKNSAIKLGAQNMYFLIKGAYTGEISPVMLKKAGCQYVILGHSERRKYFQETDEQINQKVKAALENGLIPIMCLGETKKQREAGETFSVVEKQLQIGLQGLGEEGLARIIIAYEPVWAIGTGIVAKPEQAQEVHKFIREQLASLSNSLTAERIRIQYGGSVTPENIEGLINQPDIDGALVGGASLEAKSFLEIVRKSKNSN